MRLGSGIGASTLAGEKTSILHVRAYQSAYLLTTRGYWALRRKIYQQLGQPTGFWNLSKVSLSFWCPGHLSGIQTQISKRRVWAGVFAHALPRKREAWRTTFQTAQALTHLRE